MRGQPWRSLTITLDRPNTWKARSGAPPKQVALRMRTHGKLAKWNDDRGFGFIEPAAGTEEIFVHVSAFPHDGIRPHTGELISFEIEQRADGRKQAVQVMRPGIRSVSPRRTDRNDRGPSATARQGPLAVMVSLLLVAGVSGYAYNRFTTERAPLPAPASQSITHSVLSAPESAFSCDGRTHCSQMHSCAEATYFSRQCPGTKMDGDRDGVPCERQLCSSGAPD